MAQLDKPLHLVHRDGRERTVTTVAEQVAAQFDGFGSKAAVAKAAKAAAPAKAPRKTAARKTAAKKATASPTEAAKGAPPADNASAAPVTA